MALLDSFFGNQTTLGTKPKESDFYDKTEGGDDTALDFNEWQMYQAELNQWKEIKGQREEREGIYQRMAQKVGPTPAPFTTSMPKRETPPNMMTSLFPSKFYAAGAGPVDILAPEIESIDDLYRKKPNMFRMV